MKIRLLHLTRNRLTQRSAVPRGTNALRSPRRRLYVEHDLALNGPVGVRDRRASVAPHLSEAIAPLYQVERSGRLEVMSAH
jgi:hypothetical protein